MTWRSDFTNHRCVLHSTAIPVFGTLTPCAETALPPRTSECHMTTAILPDLLSDAQTTEERFLRHIFVRDQMAEWSKQPLIMARADGVHYWDVNGKRYLDALSVIYVVSVGHNNQRVLSAIRAQLDTLC